ncbi:hypothetical protein [uncultured Jannaschia sp.]|uniref:hypothetical protein n=1 Tax=uncultured Jannaschia sp. TaxID=293347 RepID=UPI00260CF2E0|nr:hypothetical protein [uncultured Jannaschia sp.]
MFPTQFLGPKGAEIVTVASLEAGLQSDVATFDRAVLYVCPDDGEVCPFARNRRQAVVPIVFHSGYGDTPRELRTFTDIVTLPRPAHERTILKAVQSQAFDVLDASETARL